MSGLGWQELIIVMSCGWTVLLPVALVVLLVLVLKRLDLIASRLDGIERRTRTGDSVAGPAPVGGSDSGPR